MSSNTPFNFEPTPMWVLSVRDLSKPRAPALYLYSPEDREPFEFIVKDRKRQVVDTLIGREIFCASTVRIGDAVFRLKQDDDVHPETKTLSNGRKYYTLNGTVKFIGEVAAEGAE